MRRPCPVPRAPRGRSGRLTGTALGFFAAGLLKRIEPRGGPAQVLAPAPSGRGGTWNSDDLILFAPQTSGPLEARQGSWWRYCRRHPARRWRPEIAITAGPSSCRTAGTSCVFVRNEDPKNEGIYLAALDSSERTLLVNSTSSGQYAPPGRLLYVVGRNPALEEARCEWAPAALASRRSSPPRVGTSSNFSAAVSVSTNGTIAYGPRAAADALTWFDRNGNKLDTAANSARYVDFRISPDGRRVAISVVDPQTDRPDVNVLDLARPTLSRADNVK